jgi:uncharacterized membrane protein
MNKVEKDIHIDAPVHSVYEQWTHFEQFPQYMHNVKSVTKSGDKRYHWVAEIGGKTVEWDAEVTSMQPDRELAWRSVSGDKNSGEIRFQPMGEGTHLFMTIVYDPPMGVLGELGDKLTQRMSSDTEEDLKNFKKLMEGQKTYHKK